MIGGVTLSQVTRWHASRRFSNLESLNAKHVSSVSTRSPSILDSDTLTFFCVTCLPRLGKMPPKRKRTDDAEPQASSSTRATRSATRTSKGAITGAEAATVKVAVTKKTAKAATKKQAVDIDEGKDYPDDTEPSPVAKKPKTKVGSAPKAKKTTASEKAAAGDDLQDKDSKFSATQKLIVPPKSSPLKSEPYTTQRALSLFNKLCTEANIPFDGALPLILAWQLEAKEMAKISKDEWIKGMDSLKISSLPQLALAITDLDSLLIRGQIPAKKTAKKDQEPYDRSSYWTYVENTKAAFQKLYLFCFALAKTEQSRNIDMETSAAFWSVLLVPKYPLMEEVLRFINEKGTYRATNKDLWGMMLEFCETVKPTLEDYESDGAWPTLLDDFVSWKKSTTSNADSAVDVSG
ncbi:Cullin binding-domain-containing protein [Crucibulum laeve]|uniref:Defective in cullin neddylation protein n=1 Tax=Crucibulum laeve TaxID=68775 RepID=A0A5C3LSC8_9AGAR|nr:Cullin binding-domain-containing protein [Crucibulum laeve]